METAIMENQMEKKMENEMEYIGVIYYSSFHFLGIPSARVLYWVKFLDIRREGCAAALKHVRRTHKHAQHLAWLSFFLCSGSNTEVKGSNTSGGTMNILAEA